MEKDPSIGFACLPVNNTKLGSTWDRRKNFHSLMDRSILIFCGMSIFQHNPFFLIFPTFTGTYHDIYTIDFFTCVKFKQNVDEYLS